ncbi:MAG: penicillin-binding protein 2 [Anaerolineales bacterium]|nr:MAG: penicillin-binding protein 2 [Anaerolineales bacterium]
MNENSSLRIPATRLRMTYLIIIVILLIFIGRLFSLQIIQGESYRQIADDNRFDDVSIPAQRGVIYDRNDFQLVRNIPEYRVMVTPALLPDSNAEKELIYRRISGLTGVPLDQEGPIAAPCIPGRGVLQLINEGLTNRPFDAWPIACDVDETVARVLREEQIDLPGVSVIAVPVRDYTTGELTAAMVGYMGPIPAGLADYYEELGFLKERDKIGYAGIEVGYLGMYQEILAGQNGLKLVERDVAGQYLRDVGTFTQPIPGNNMRLTIDTRLQAAAETALRNRMDFINRYSGEERTPLGVVIAMNPQTGEILAMVSLPTYENNRFARFIPQDYYQQLEDDTRGSPLTNHAIASEFPPGSTFKMVTAVGALNEEVITPDRKLFDPGKITIENKYFPQDPGKAKDFICWKREGHGDVDFVHGIAWSCNVYFYKIGGGYPGEIEDGGLGVTGINTYAPALGYGAPLGIDLPGEEDGLIPDEDWKRINLGENWSTGDTYNTVVGQGFVAATPLQVLTSIATIANGGRVMWPHIIQEVLDGEGNIIQRYEPCVLWDIGDGVLTPLEEIGANCPTMPAELREFVQNSRSESPDVLVDPAVIELAQAGMHLVVTDPDGTAYGRADLETISSAGKTGTGEFCDQVVYQQGLCKPGEWPTHSWYVAYAPFENPEIAVVAFVYYGGEGAITSGPIVRQVLEAYFEIKSIDAARAQ